VPLLAKGHPVDWFFVFKLNAATFPKCGAGDTRTCPFGGQVQNPPDNKSYSSFGQQYIFASSEAPTLQDGTKDCLGDTTSDPVGATFDEVYNGNFHYVIWNDQTYQDPKINGCSGNGCDAPWGHSKGMLAWNEEGEGFIMQVSTPSWPAAGSTKFPRTPPDGNSLGCVKDNDVQVSQHFFALKLTKDDVVEVLTALGTASVVTDPSNPQLVNNGGPSNVQQLVSALGTKSTTVDFINEKLSSGVRLIAKPSDLNVPPWQMVSSLLGGVSLRTATWWDKPKINSTSATTNIDCWDSSLSSPGPVEIATTGSWKGTQFALTAGGGGNGNHAKIGVSTSDSDHLAIFGDMNQQGTLTAAAATSTKGCASSQNGRGGLFFVMDSAPLATSLTALIKGDSAPVAK
jgi:hypothetical protein